MKNSELQEHIVLGIAQFGSGWHITLQFPDVGCFIGADGFKSRSEATAAAKLWAERYGEGWLAMQ